MPVSILFVCLGNICRSPTAEQVFRALVSARNLTEKFHLDSAGTGDWHIGHPPDPRAQQTALNRGYDLSKLRARQITQQDFTSFDLIIAMDNANIQRLQNLNANLNASQLEKIKLLLSYIKNSVTTEVPDPYFGTETEFEQSLNLIEQGCAQLLDDVISRQL